MLDAGKKKSFSRFVSDAYTRSANAIAPHSLSLPGSSTSSISVTATTSSSDLYDPLDANQDIRSSHSVRLKLNGSLNAMAAGPERGYVIVSGREVLKILHITHDTVIEETNLRVGSRLNINFSSNDVTWGHSVSRNKIATAAANGSIVLWDLHRTGQKVEKVLTEHSRAVNRVRFDPTNGFILLSASQDGSLKLWDIRDRNPMRITFDGKSEAVRDVCFNYANPVEFAAAFDNGTIQKWDVRRSNLHERKINAHRGTVLSVDWHADGKTIASGGMDKTIKIWNFYADSPNLSVNSGFVSAMGIASLPNVNPHFSGSISPGSTMRAGSLMTIRAVAPVSRVVWRHAHDFQVSSSSLSTDSRLMIWDVRRPHIPKLIISQHESNITGIYWAEPNKVWTCSKDRFFMQHDTKVDAFKAIEALPKSCAALSVWGELAFVAEENTGREDMPFDQLDGVNPVEIGMKKNKKKKNKTSQEDYQMIDLPQLKYKPTQTTGVVSLPSFDAACFIYIAENSVLVTEDVWGACDINAQLCWDVQHYKSCQTWKILQILYGTRPDEMKEESSSSTVDDDVDDTTTDHGSEHDEDADDELGKSGMSNSVPVLTRQPVEKTSRSSSKSGLLEGLTIDKPSSVDGFVKPTLPDRMMQRRSSSLGAEGESTNIYKQRGRHWSGLHRTMVELAKEGSKGNSMKEYYPYVNYDYGNEFETNSKRYGSSHTENENNVNKSSMRNSKSLTPPPTVSRGGFQSSLIHNDEKLGSLLRKVKSKKSLDDVNGVTIGGVGNSNSINMQSSIILQPERFNFSMNQWDHTLYVRTLLDWYADSDDIQTCVTMAFVIGSCDMEMKKWMKNSGRWKRWVWGYIELLERFQLWCVRNEVIENSKIPEMMILNQELTSIWANCHNCGKSLGVQRSGKSSGLWICGQCQKLQGICVICHLPVRGLLVWCQGCGHGGHSDHICKWFGMNKSNLGDNGKEKLENKNMKSTDSNTRLRVNSFGNGMSLRGSSSNNNINNINTLSVKGLGVECPTGCGHKCVMFRKTK